MEAVHTKKYKEQFPKCVKNILILAGFESVASLHNITDSIIKDIEKYVNTKPEVLKNIDCCFADTYQNMRQFEFVPGHKAVILAIPALINSADEPKKMKSEEYIKTSLSNCSIRR